jgi:ubiquinone/menaquinone biosynthesis C-methylase UbiE
MRDEMTQIPLTTNTPAENVCRYSFWHILMLDNPFRRFFQNPEKILGGNIRPGSTVIDIGCGPGDFTKTMAAMAGKDGRVIAIDLQEAMLRHAQEKCGKNNSAASITWHRCMPDSLGITAQAGFALSFYMVHEVPDQDRFFREIFQCLKPDGKYLLVEPVFHVTEAAFSSTLEAAAQAGFRIDERPEISLSRTAVLVK